jgi:hypothetical protein
LLKDEQEPERLPAGKERRNGRITGMVQPGCRPRFNKFKASSARHKNVVKTLTEIYLLYHHLKNAIIL